MRKKNCNKSYNSSNLSADIEMYIKQLKVDQQNNPVHAAEEARKALIRTGVMAKSSTNIKKRIVSWE